MIPTSISSAAALLCAAALPAAAQAVDAPPDQAAGSANITATATASAARSTVVITGRPRHDDALDPPVQVLGGEELALRRAPTLGDTLSGLPGVASSAFGPQSSRPVIRGLDGDRIRLLDNGGAATDASNLSFDHAVAIDPLVVERLEVLRGPAALLYGGNATGGVVNAIDNRIPRLRLGDLDGRAELRLGGAADERAGAVVLEGALGADPKQGLNWHVDAAARNSDDLRTPRFTPGAAFGLATPDASAQRRIGNSAGRSRAGALGLSWADADGYVGLSLDETRNHYGVVVEPDVTIRMQRQRLALAAERRNLPGVVETLSLQASHTRYRHDELEGDGAVGTRFESRGGEFRLTARQREQLLGGAGSRWRLDGSLGVQAETLDFNALGTEAFVPPTHTRSQALFVLQELSRSNASDSAAGRTGDALRLSLGVRGERVRVDSDGGQGSAPQFGDATSRRFSPVSAMLGAALPLSNQVMGAGGWTLQATLGHTERAPAYYELYANGLHVATGVVEVGDPTLALERSRHAELGLQWQRGADLLRASLWQTRFSNYIALDASGRNIDVESDGETHAVPEYRFIGVPARLHGLELEARTGGRGLADVLPATWQSWQWELSGSFDWLRGENRRSGEALPRLPPWRLSGQLELRRGAWQWALALRHQARQDRVPATDRPTPSATLVDLALAWRQPLAGDAEALWSLKLTNVGNVLAYNASTVLPARVLAPSGARALSAGVRIAF